MLTGRRWSTMTSGLTVSYLAAPQTADRPEMVHDDLWPDGRLSTRTRLTGPSPRASTANWTTSPRASAANRTTSPARPRRAGPHPARPRPAGPSPRASAVANRITSTARSHPGQPPPCASTAGGAISLRPRDQLDHIPCASTASRTTSPILGASTAGGKRENFPRRHGGAMS